MLGKAIHLLSIGIISLLLWSEFVEDSAAQNQIIPDSMLPGESSIIDTQGSVTFIEGGATRGENLFHSFDEFNIPAGKGAYFLVRDLAIDNIFSRITGDNPSNIDGVLGALIGRDSGLLSNANLYLMNPNGIVFGENASLNLGGATVITTADSLQFGEQGLFSTLNSETPSQLLVVDPSAFLFTQSEIAGIDVKAQNLTLPAGQDLVLVGGDISFDNARVFGTAGGGIKIGGISEAGKIGVDDSSSFYLTFEDDITQRANIKLDLSSLLFATGRGDIVLKGKDISIDNGSFVSSLLAVLPDTNDSESGDIIVNASGDIDINNASGIISGIFGDRGQPAGRVGDIDISGQSVQAANGSGITSLTLGQGNAGNVKIRAVEEINLDASFAGSPVFSSQGLDVGPIFQGLIASGSGGNVIFQAPRIVFDNGASINSRNFSSGTGNAGTIQILASDVFLMRNGSFLGTETFGTGNAGAINVYAENLVSIAGVDANGNRTSISSSANAVSGLETNREGGSISISTSEQSAIEIIEGTISSNVEAGAIGTGGAVTLRTGTLRLSQGGQVQSLLREASNDLAGAQGRAGDISITASDKIMAAGRDRNNNMSGFFTNAGAGTRGNAGNISINAGTLDFSESAISSLTSSVGNAGQINIRAQDIQLKNDTLITSTTFGQGQGESITIHSNRLVAQSGGQI